MGLGKTCAKPSMEGLGLGYVRYSSFGRKRVVISNDMEVDFIDNTPKKKQCNDVNLISSCDKSVLEALPQDVLIRVLCGVEHDDLKRLFHVSKSIREATLIAKHFHFAYSTPTKRLAFRSPIDLLDSNDFDEFEAPNAPKQSRVPRSRIASLISSRKEEEGWPKRKLFLDMETEM